MATAKERIREIIRRQPDDSSFDEIVRELAFDLMVQRGLKDSDEQRTISNEDMERRIKTDSKELNRPSPPLARASPIANQKSKIRNPFSFIPQSHQWIHFRCASGRNIAR